MIITDTSASCDDKLVWTTHPQCLLLNYGIMEETHDESLRRIKYEVSTKRVKSEEDQTS